MLPHSHLHLVIWPMGLVDEFERLTTHPTPVDAAQRTKIGFTKVERAAVEQQGSPSLVDGPKAAAVGTRLASTQKIAVQIDVAKAEHTFLGDDEFLIHFS